MAPLVNTAKQLRQVSNAVDVAEDPTVRPSPALARPPSHQGQNGRLLAASTPLHTLGPSPPLQAPQPAGAPNVTVVWTAEQLQRGVQDGARDIEIRAHLDMRKLRSVPHAGVQSDSPIATTGGHVALLHASSTLRSIRGTCADPDAAAALGVAADDPDTERLLPIKPLQCLVIVGDTWLQVWEGRVWVDNVYLRFSQRGNLHSQTAAFIRLGSETADPGSTLERRTAYATSTTFHMDRNRWAAAVRNAGLLSSVYLDECILTGWRVGSAPLVFVFDTVANVRNTVLLDMRLTAGVADMTGVSTVRFENVSLADVTLVQGDVISTGLYHYEALEYPDNDPPEDDAGMDAETEVSLEWVPPEHRSIFGEQYIISEAILTRCVEWKVDRHPWCQGEHTQRRGQAELQQSMIHANDTWLASVQMELPERPVAPPDWPPFTLPELDDDKTSVPQPSLVPLLSESARAGTLATPVAGLDQSGSSNRSGTFIAIVALIVIIGVICIAMSAYFSLHWRRRRVKRRPMEGQAGKVEPGGEPPQAAPVGGTASLHAPHSDGDLVRQQRQVARKIRQLDELRKGELFLGRFRLLGRDACIVGGQTVVQFAEGVKDGRDYAIKFFLDRSAFIAEAALYAMCDPRIRSRVSPEVRARADAAAGQGMDGQEAVPLSQVGARFLPRVDAVRDGMAEGFYEDRQWKFLPPCIVMEKGESLQDWSERAKPDFFAALAVLFNISQRLAELHDAGFVHHNLKPSNVMWLPRQNRWTVVGFGCVARTGTAAPLNFTLAYAAPEVVQALSMERKDIESVPALDAWSLGVMAFELLTGAPAFDFASDGRATVMQRLRGDLPLPWEGDLSSQVKTSLGTFRRLTLALLHRQPCERITMRGFNNACTDFFAAQTTIHA